MDDMDIDAPQARDTLAWQQHETLWVMLVEQVRLLPQINQRHTLSIIVGDIFVLVAKSGNLQLRGRYIPTMNHEQVCDLMTNQLSDEDFEAWYMALEKRDWETALTPRMCTKLLGIYSHKH